MEEQAQENTYPENTSLERKFRELQTELEHTKAILSITQSIHEQMEKDYKYQQDLIRHLTQLSNNLMEQVNRGPVIIREER